MIKSSHERKYYLHLKNNTYLTKFINLCDSDWVRYMYWNLLANIPNNTTSRATDEMLKYRASYSMHKVGSGYRKDTEQMGTLLVIYLQSFLSLSVLFLHEESVHTCTKLKLLHFPITVPSYKKLNLNINSCNHRKSLKLHMHNQQMYPTQTVHTDGLSHTHYQLYTWYWELC